MPSPKLCRSLPEGSNSRIGGRFEPAQVFAPHLSATHMLPWRSTSTPAVDPQGRPSGSFAQFSMVRYGLGWEFRAASSCAYAVPPDVPIGITNKNTMALTTVNPTRPTRGIMTPPQNTHFKYAARFYRFATSNPHELSFLNGSEEKL